ncbi:uncharacterized protein BDV17DRAFT_284986 [Aspergillus undulatus]|uniref:uncharacterized protein n=1 Tax=Aspergillus undulatus TaxID=1810928 RepID=UPI003CCD0C36
MADRKAPFHGLSSDNRGPIITLVSVSLLIVAVIFVLAKFGSAIYFKQRQTAVNTPIWVALIIAIIQVVLLQKAVDNGLGRHQDRLSESDVQAMNKFAYAAHILLVIVLSLSKMSTVLLIWKLTPSGSLRRYCTITTGIVVAWTIFAILGIGLQCDIHEPWIYAPGRCAGEGALFYPVAVLNVLTEVILVILPFIMMRNVQMVWRKRIKILSSFSTRIGIVGLGIAQLALIPSFARSTDVSWSIIDYEVISQTMMLTTVTIACVPTLYHIFAGLHSGLTTTEVPLGVGLELSRPKASGYINQTSSSGSKSRSRGRSREKRGRESPIFNPHAADAAITTEITSNLDHYRGRHGERGSSESEGTESTRQLTREVEVDHRDEESRL